MSKSRVPERRRVKRRPILDTFAIFLVIPKKGIHKLATHDVSEDGIGFDLTLEDEPPSDWNITSGTLIDLNLYLNSSLYIPLTVQVVRIETKEGIHRAGAIFQDHTSTQYQVFLAFLKLIDTMLDIAQVEKPGN